jgi:four helix bundle protein
MARSNGLHALELAQLIAAEVKELIDTFPPSAPLGFRIQLGNAANSVHSNIAEGYGRVTAPERRNKLRLARGELEEAQSQLKVASQVRYIAEKDFYRTWNRTRVLYRMLVKLARRP